MNLQETVKQLERIGECLEGIAWIGLGLGFMYTVYLSRNLWIEKKKTGREKEKKHKKRKGRKKYKLLMWASTILAAGRGETEVKAETKTEVKMPEIRIQTGDTSCLEREGTWYYAKECSIYVWKTESGEKEEETEKTMEVSVFLKNEKEEWEEAEEEKLRENEICILEKKEGEMWEITFTKEIQCRITGEIWEEGKEEPDCQVGQEIVLDMTPPTVKETLVYYQTDQRRAEPENGCYYGGEALEEELGIEDFTGALGVICQGKKQGADEIVFEREFCEEEKIQMKIPEDFFGKLEWKITDYAGNVKIWEQPEIFCTESAHRHQEHAGIWGEVLEMGQNQAVVQVKAEDKWSGLRKIWMKKNGKIIWEEWQDHEDRYIWEKSLTVPLGEETEIYLEIWYEDRAGHGGKQELFLERRKEGSKTEGNQETTPDTEEPDIPAEKEEETETLEPWKEDKENPVITISGVEKEKTYSGTVVLNIQIHEPWLNREKTICVLRRETGGEIFLEQTGENQYTWETEKGKEGDDIYHLEVKAWDLAGNTAEENIIFQINRQGSVFSVKGLNENKIYTPGNELIIQEENRSAVNHRTIMYIWEGKPYLLRENTDYTVAARREDEKWKYQYRLNPALFLREGRYTIHILTGDEAGNRRSNLNYFDKQGNGKKLPVEFHVENRQEKIPGKSEERGEIYFRGKENEKEEKTTKEESCIENTGDNKEFNIQRNRQLTEKKKIQTDKKKSDGENKNTEKYNSGKTEKVTDGWKWIIPMGILFWYLGKRKLWK